MQFEPPSSPYPPNPFSSPYGYYPTPPPPNFANARAHTFYEYGGAGSIPTPAPSPRTPHHSRRRSHDYTTSEFPGLRRAATHDHGEFSPHDYSTPPPRPHTRAGAAYMHTPLHTPPSTSHGNHGGAPPPFFSSHMPGFPQSDYVSELPHVMLAEQALTPHSSPHHSRAMVDHSHPHQGTVLALPAAIDANPHGLQVRVLLVRLLALPREEPGLQD